YLVDITIHRGAGAYICGEKSALLESLEGNRGHPRLKPHTPKPEFYFGQPTLVTNVETIASVPFIVENGADAYRTYGTDMSPGTLLFSLSGNITYPGVYEAEFGVSMLEYIETMGGGVKNGKKLKAVIPGGASTPILPASMLKDARLDYESLKSLGSALGTGGMIVLDEDASMVKALKNLLRFYHHESCGQCTPCREGTSWVDKTLDKFITKTATQGDLKILKSVSGTMNGKTICVFAPAVSGVIDGFLKHFENEFLECIV
ncbi:MAG: NADH-quinone oxidoreductase subunit F, partial [ANME-2 cluster archaeon]